MNSIRRWADEAQYTAEPIRAHGEDGNIIPKVTLLWMTPDPLGAIAAMCRMYEGKPTYRLGDVTEEERQHYFDQAMATHLRAPLEAVKFHFFIEGVTRSFTHQMVRQRTAVYSQESLRFAVKENLASEVSLPPSIAALPKKDSRRQRWDDAVAYMGDVYNSLVANGIPAEDARGLMPHAVTTRLNFVTDLRNLSDHAGNRLCTQAQFEWRIVFLGIVQAIRDYAPDFGFISGEGHRSAADEAWGDKYHWQQEALANSALFRPVCYQLGKCPFKASFDRACSIRSRVDAFAAEGVPSHVWGDDSWMTSKEDHLNIIHPSEWLADPAAARRTSGGGGHE